VSPDFPELNGAPVPANLALGVLALALSVSVVTDVWQRRILNAVTYPSFALLVLCILWLGGPALVGAALLAAVLCAVPLALAMSRGWIGAGDVKLIALPALVSGATAGWPSAVTLLVDISLAGGAQALLWLAVSRIRHRERPRSIPYALAIAAGSAWALLVGTPLI
jgi:prepilin peptidase CpaA